MACAVVRQSGAVWGRVFCERFLDGIIPVSAALPKLLMFVHDPPSVFRWQPNRCDNSARRTLKKQTLNGF